MRPADYRLQVISDLSTTWSVAAGQHGDSGSWSESCYRAYLAKIANQDGVGAMCQNVIFSIRSGVMTELKIPSGVRVVDGVRGPLSARASTGQYRVVPLTIARSQPPVAGADVRKPKD